MLSEVQMTAEQALVHVVVTCKAGQAGQAVHEGPIVQLQVGATPSSAVGPVDLAWAPVGFRLDDASGASTETELRLGDRLAAVAFDHVACVAVPVGPEASVPVA